MIVDSYSNACSFHSKTKFFGTTITHASCLKYPFFKCFHQDRLQSLLNKIRRIAAHIIQFKQIMDLCGLSPIHFKSLPEETENIISSFHALL